MSFEIKIEIEFPKELIVSATESPRVLAEEEFDKRARSAMQESVDYLQSLVVAGTPQLTGATASRIYTRLEGTGVNLVGVVASPDEYFLTLEYGRRPGAKMPPREAIEAWGAVKGITSRQSIYLISRAIARRGLPAHHIMQRAFETGQGRLLEIFRRHFESFGVIT